MSNNLERKVWLDLVTKAETGYSNWRNNTIDYYQQAIEDARNYTHILPVTVVKNALAIAKEHGWAEQTIRYSRMLDIGK